MKETAGLGEGRAYFAGSAVAVVGQDLDDDGHAARPVAFIANLVVALGFAAARLLDRAIDIVLGHVLRPGSDDRGAQARVHDRIGQSQLGEDGDFPRQLSEQLGFGRILPPLAVHDVFELGMAGHGVLLDGLPRASAKRDRRSRGQWIDLGRAIRTRSRSK
jgi:hypothetical protein